MGKSQSLTLLIIPRYACGQEPSTTVSTEASFIHQELETDATETHSQTSDGACVFLWKSWGTKLMNLKGLRTPQEGRPTELTNLGP